MSSLKKLRIRNIDVITPIYPLQMAPERGIFVETLVKQWQSLGVDVNVISPISLPDLIRFCFKKNVYTNIEAKKIERPLYVSIGNRKIGQIDMHSLSRRIFINAALRRIKHLEVPDVYYGKFFLRGGVVAMLAGMSANRPAFADMGESNLSKQLPDNSKSWLKHVLQSLTGIVCVSYRLHDEIVKLGANPNKILVLPNEADRSQFKPLNRNDCRQKLGLPEGAFIVAFTGHFIERKGPLRVLQAIRTAASDNVYGVFFGQGPQKPAGPQVLHAGPIHNEELPTWLNAANVFVLPTTAEGSCNAICEAVSCGLPIISSDIPDIREQLNDENAILVDPFDISAIAEAINIIQSDPEHQKRGIKLVKSESQSNLPTGQRAKMIYEWMVSRL
ncbi:glycosyltransferase [uncultured Desulfosarcina sp.]|uniref:glycosyltransferase n=1 Tax=uncultured Desulfosarcina sp. TaxID=218289 RepID=UPI0029C88277|nr:glycosyltransferase [uncultured Desulfosarcina sp.]